MLYSLLASTALHARKYGTFEQALNALISDSECEMDKEKYKELRKQVQNKYAPNDIPFLETLCPSCGMLISEK